MMDEIIKELATMSEEQLQLLLEILRGDVQPPDLMKRI